LADECGRSDRALKLVCRKTCPVNSNHAACNFQLESMCGTSTARTMLMRFTKLHATRGDCGGYIMRERVVTCGSSHHLRWYEPPQNEHNVNA
jgi:hypothetical protein